MENKENLVTEQVTEKVEQTTEESPKMYTEAEFNAKLDDVIGKKLARREAKIRKEYDREYGDLVETLKAGTGKQSVGEISDTFKQFYAKNGVKMPTAPQYSAKDIEILAKAEADEIVSGGFEDVVEEVDRLTKLGAENMSAKEKEVFKILAEHRQSAERTRELAAAGIPADVYNSSEFTQFAGKFNAQTPIGDVYDIYQKMQPKKEIKPMGSMKNTDSDDSMVKDYYSPEEARKFTRKELDENPALFKAIEKSMPKWRK